MLSQSTTTTLTKCKGQGGIGGVCNRAPLVYQIVSRIKRKSRGDSANFVNSGEIDGLLLGQCEGVGGDERGRRRRGDRPHPTDPPCGGCSRQLKQREYQGILRWREFLGPLVTAEWRQITTYIRRKKLLILVGLRNN